MNEYMVRGSSCEARPKMFHAVEIVTGINILISQLQSIVSCTAASSVPPEGMMSHCGLQSGT